MMNPGKSYSVRSTCEHFLLSSSVHTVFQFLSKIIIV